MWSTPELVVENLLKLYNGEIEGKDKMNVILSWDQRQSKLRCKYLAKQYTWSNMFTDVQLTPPDWKSINNNGGNNNDNDGNIVLCYENIMYYDEAVLFDEKIRQLYFDDDWILDLGPWRYHSDGMFVAKNLFKLNKSSLFENNNGMLKDWWNKREKILINEAKCIGELRLFGKFRSNLLEWSSYPINTDPATIVKYKNLVMYYCEAVQYDILYKEYELICDRQRLDLHQKKINEINTSYHKNVELARKNNPVRDLEAEEKHKKEVYRKNLHEKYKPSINDHPAQRHEKEYQAFIHQLKY